MYRHFESLESRSLFTSAHFAVIGDFGQPGPGELAISNLVKSWNPEFIVTVGDNSYPTAAAQYIDTNIGQYYHDFIYNYHGSYGAGSPTRRFYPALGNHDWGNVVPGDASSYLNYFDLPGNERYYDFAAGPVHFFIIDSDPSEPDGTAANSIQGQWLQSKLAAATEPHKLVVFHHPPYSSGGAHGSETRMRWPFAKWGATAVLAGHEHDYERLSEEGIPYFINGLGGASIANFASPIAGSEFRYNADYGAMLVDATDTSIEYKFFSRAGVLIDTYAINLNTSKTLVQAGSVWHYNDSGQNLGAAWRTPAPGIDPWPSGDAQIGYGDGDESTTVGFGPNPNSKYITTYLRRTFNVADKNAINGLKLSLLRDDGAVVYLNGTEVFRSNMPAGTIAFNTLAGSALGGEDEGNYYSANLRLSPLLDGENALTVELHQSGGTSSDISFDLALIATGDFTPAVPTFAGFAYDSPPMSVRFSFDKNISTSLSADDLLLENATTKTTIDPDKIHVAWIPSENLAVFTFPGLAAGVLPDGHYRATLRSSGLPIAVDYSAQFFFLLGDANHDAKINIADLRIFAANFSKSGKVFSDGDFDFDGDVDRFDLSILSRNWAISLPPPPPPIIAPAVSSAFSPHRPAIRAARQIVDRANLEA